MKKLLTNKMILLVTVLTFSTIQMNADTQPEPGNKARAGAQKTISDYFKVPGFISPMHAFKKDSTQKVKVLFTTGGDGRVNFVLADCLDKRLKNEIEQRFAGLTLTTLPREVVHSVTISFQVM